MTEAAEDLSALAEPSARRPLGRRLLWPGIGLGLLAATVAAAVVVGATPPGPAAPVAAATTATSTAPAPSPEPTTKKSPLSGPEGPPTVYADPAALADLDAVAATLTTPITLTSPTGWDRWLPDRKPYPGADTADDLSTCPVLSDRLGGALGTRMSYWVGTLPMGPYGCQWATVPLYAGPDAPNYPYLANVGFVSDGSTSAQLSGGFYHHGNHLCPSVAVPTVGADAYLTRCEELDGVSYVLTLPDRRTGGVWVLAGQARDDAAHPAIDVLRPVLAGAATTFG
jgi:hypothetical protein